MTREEYVKSLILSQNQSVKGFAKSIGLPYTTLLGMLKNGLGRAAVDNVIKVCRGLRITVDELVHVEDNPAPILPFYVSEKEKRIISEYRSLPHRQDSVDTLLGLTGDERHN